MSEHGEPRIERPPSREENIWAPPYEPKDEGGYGYEPYYPDHDGDEQEGNTPRLYFDRTDGSAPGSGVSFDPSLAESSRSAERTFERPPGSERPLRDEADNHQAGFYTPEQEASVQRMERDAVKIGLWGSPGSGKTTFLAALRHAANDMNGQYGRWGIFPLNTLSSRLLVEFTHDLNQGNFPQATLPGATTELKWMFVGDLAKSRLAGGRRRLLRPGKAKSQFVLDLIDVSGKAFGYNPDAESVPPNVAQEALKHLSEARGLIYLFDPIGERDSRDSLDYVNRTIVELKELYARTGQVGPHLPQHLSVCITKFDHPDVFKEARRNGFVNFGPDGMPRVLDQHAEAFFDLLCTGRFWSNRYEQGDRSARFVRNELRNAFDPRNIRYFVMSSIGFWKPPGWSAGSSEFNPEDFSNYRRVRGNEPSIRGAISPINVLEPLIQLQQRLDRRM